MVLLGPLGFLCFFFPMVLLLLFKDKLLEGKTKKRPIDIGVLFDMFLSICILYKYYCKLL